MCRAVRLPSAEQCGFHLNEEMLCKKLDKFWVLINFLVLYPGNEFPGIFEHGNIGLVQF
jgi:hypothetical protein